MIKPMREQVLIEHLEQDEKTSGGIIIPESAREKQRRAKVVAVGKGWQSKKGKVSPLAVKVGDIVLVGSNMDGVDVTFKGKKYELIRENYIFGIIG